MNQSWSRPTTFFFLDRQVNLENALSQKTSEIAGTAQNVSPLISVRGKAVFIDGS